MADKVKQKLIALKGVIFDADGVFFTGQETRGVLASGEVVVCKTRSLIDGQGISFLRALGVQVVFATGEGEPLSSIVAKLNELPSVRSGAWAPIEHFTKQKGVGGKVPLLEQWLVQKALTWNDCAYMGDDRTDVEAMKLAGFKVAPANAQPFIKAMADVVTDARGGDGAIREFADMVLEARGVDPQALPVA